jgi:ubiquinone/menaquinone biosynthesis C-methylase UbiE
VGILKRAGLKSGKTLLDYGCGNGLFVRYAREHGVHAEGYDPYSQQFGDASVLDRSYDFVTAQDVLEHVDDPRAVLHELKSYVAPGGCIAVGTPNADEIDLYQTLDLGLLHQPYHRHIPSAAELRRMALEGGGQVLAFSTDWYRDTLVPFVNSAFMWRYINSGGGFLDVILDPVRPLDFLTHPSLIFWGLFGSFFPQKCEMAVVARAPARGHLETTKTFRGLG